MGIVHQKQEHIAITSVKRRGILGDVHERIMRHGRPIQHARHLPHGVAGAVARDVNHGGDKLVIPDAAIVRTGDSAKCEATVIGFQCFQQLSGV